jgi:hypothetical protein
MLISQIIDADDRIGVVAGRGTEAYLVKDAESVYALAREAIASGIGIADNIRAHGLGPAVDLEALADEGRVTLPITHPDPAHMHLTGTGLTHLGSASMRRISWRVTLRSSSIPRSRSMPCRFAVISAVSAIVPSRPA